ncbi:hypothetical protein M0811_06254 [Anaeramoeba ignava]|uniref:Uncharacterized protein n=1 Tax=Anaeramoeba ignava TaxID=1746090 RepID=A0A9Q0RE11_ANAIG|nr:hypothetical protein M0811_06254 [Anaeramoeba ignava]
MSNQTIWNEKENQTNSNLFNFCCLKENRILNQFNQNLNQLEMEIKKYKTNQQLIQKMRRKKNQLLNNLIYLKKEFQFQFSESEKNLSKFQNNQNEKIFSNSKILKMQKNSLQIQKKEIPQIKIEMEKIKQEIENMEKEENESLILFKKEKEKLQKKN